MPRIVIDVLRDRTRPGELRFESDGDCFGRWICLAKADNAQATASGNPKRIPAKVDGDTPTGTFRVLDIRAKVTSMANTRTYGPHPMIYIEGISGDALTAKINNRRGLAIHGGAARADGGLRPTHGCVRMLDASMAELNALFLVYGMPTQVIVEEVS